MKQISLIAIFLFILILSSRAIASEIEERDPFDLPEEAKLTIIENLADDITRQQKLSIHKPGFEAEQSLPALNIQGVVISDQPTAIINNQVVGPGDTISGVEITKITKTEIIVKFRDALYALPVKQ